MTQQMQHANALGAEVANLQNSLKRIAGDAVNIAERRELERLHCGYDNYRVGNAEVVVVPEEMTDGEFEQFYISYAGHGCYCDRDRAEAFYRVGKLLAVAVERYQRAMRAVFGN